MHNHIFNAQEHASLVQYLSTISIQTILQTKLKCSTKPATNTIATAPAKIHCPPAPGKISVTFICSYMTVAYTPWLPQNINLYTSHKWHWNSPHKNGELIGQSTSDHLSTVLLWP